jgi:choline dehydrogenase-like flavoprotein
MPAVGSFHGTCSRNEGYGAPLKKAIRDSYGTVVTMSGRGEMVPNDKSYCEIDPHTVDQYGIPVLRFHFQWNEYEPKQTQHMHDTFSEIYHTMGGQVVGPGADGWTGVSVGGVIIHELGTVRMGDDSRTSALNKYCQAHDVRNLFVADAAPFLSNPDKNPTLTICALAWRTADYLTDQLRRGDV